METFTRQDFVNLAEISDPKCVSILMPAHPTGRENTQDPIRFKNLLKEAEQALVDRGERSSDARGRLDPLRDYSEDATFWAHQQEGLAAFAVPSGTHVFGVPFSLQERAVVGQKCYLLPLISTLTEDARFLVLAISPNEVRLFEGTRFSNRELDLPGWPEDFQELAAYIDEEAYLQFHSGAQPTGSQRPGGSVVREPGAADKRKSDRAGVFHGHTGDDAASVKKQRLLEYCRLIDGRVRDAIDVEDRIPLILACDERLAPIYRSASDYNHVVAEPVTGNPDGRSGDELCRAAWSILEPRIQQDREKAVSLYGEAAGNNQSANHLESVLTAAQDGRIDTLLVANDVAKWGRYDAGERSLEVHDSPSAGDDELINLAAVSAHLQGAAVYGFAQRDLPEDSPVLAVLRF